MSTARVGVGSSGVWRAFGVVAVTVAMLASHGCASTTSRQTRTATVSADSRTGREFGSSDEAWNALIAAVRSGSRDQILAVLGEDARPIIASADGLDDARAQKAFLQRADQRTEFRRADGGVVMA